MAEPRVRPAVGFTMFQSDTGSVLTQERMYGKIEQLVMPEPESEYREIRTAMGRTRFRQTWDLGTLSSDITEWTFEPERLVDDGLYHFETIVVLKGGADAPNTEVSRRARLVAHMNFPNFGTHSVEAGSPTNIGITLMLEEIWLKPVGSTSTFSGDTPTSDDLIRINPGLLIYWCNGRDVNTSRRTILKGE